MKRFVIGLMTVILMGCAPEPNESTGVAVNWVPDYHLGMAQARENGNAAMLFFTADWWLKIPQTIFFFHLLNAFHNIIKIGQVFFDALWIAGGYIGAT